MLTATYVLCCRRHNAFGGQLSSCAGGPIEDNFYRARAVLFSIRVDYKPMSICGNVVSEELLGRHRLVRRGLKQRHWVFELDSWSSFDRSGHQFPVTGQEK